MNSRKEKLYLILAALFTGSLVVSNLIANKFFSIDILGKEWILSAGVIPYPLTFLVTDILSEIYGKKRANQVVLGGFLASLLVILTLALANITNATDGSPVNDKTFNNVFGNSYRVISASMVAYLIAQLLDIRIFHFWKKLTNGRHLWLRNNASTTISQLADSILVVCVLFLGQSEWPPERIFSTIIDLWLFKTLVAFIDTPLFYFCAHWIPQMINTPKET
jgi:uncharacterized integral membrane protein (TIGR00697 family)